jgi:hypothetical protein
MTKRPTAITVLILLAFVASSAASSFASSTSSLTYRFVGAPIVPIERATGGGFVFDVYARLNHTLPRKKSGRLDAWLQVDDANGADGIVTVGPTGSRCYAGPIDGVPFTRSPALLHPKAGRMVIVTLYVRGKAAAHRRVALSHELKPVRENADAPYLAGLGCRRPK